MFIFLAFVAGGVLGWLICNRQIEDSLPPVIREKEQEEYDKTITQIYSDVGSDFEQYFGVRGTIFNKPAFRDESNPAVVLMLDNFINMVSVAYFSEVDEEQLMDYINENQIDCDDSYEAIDHYGKKALEQYNSARRQKFEALIDDIQSGSK